jgi:VanZ family protein
VLKVRAYKWRGRIIAFAPLFVWIGVVFLLSSPQGSMAETSRIIGPLIAFFFPNASPDTFLTIHMLIRKTAHFTEYAILAFFAVRAFGRSTGEVLRKYRFILALFLVMAVASVDEINQTFEPSRTGAFGDVLLDISGGIFMLIVLFIVKRPRLTVN